MLILFLSHFLKREKKRAEEIAAQEFLRKRELKVLRIKQVLSEMDRQCSDIKNELRALEECLNLLFPALDFHGSSLSRSNSLVQIDREQAEIVRANESEEVLSHEKGTPPPETTTPLFPGLHLDLHHLLSNQQQHHFGEDFRKTSDENDDSEWEDGSVLGDHESIGDSYSKKRKHNDSTVRLRLIFT